MRIPKPMLRFTLALAVMPAAVLCIATASAASTEAAPPGPSQIPSAAAPATQALTDAEILAVLAAINDASIEQAQAAHKRASDHRVKKFAQSVEKRNEWAKRRETKLSKQHNLHAAGGKSVEDFRQSFKQAFLNLEALPSGAKFDQLYIRDEIAALNHIADTIDNKLLPHARLNHLRIELNTVRDAVKHDLKKAHELSERLDKASK